jgi:hypothetical protein
MIRLLLERLSYIAAKKESSFISYTLRLPVERVTRARILLANYEFS